jgi:lysophospholipase L1-like esterase
MKLVVLGDSISEGIGRKKINYCNDLKAYLENLGIKNQIINNALTGTTIEYAVSNLNKFIEERPHVVIIMYGSVDAQIRPNIEKNRYRILDVIPSKYKNIGGMIDPRAFYSETLYRRVFQKMDNAYRYLLKKLLTLTQGTYQKVSLNDFYTNYEKLVKCLLKSNIKIICVSTVYIDDKYFLDSSCEYAKYNEMINKISIRYKAKFVDVFSILKEDVVKKGWNNLYSSDHFHPNFNGYQKLAVCIGEAVAEELGYN